jgi:hypothetical protein
LILAHPWDTVREKFDLEARLVEIAGSTVRFFRIGTLLKGTNCMRVIRRNVWRIVAVCVAVCGSAALSFSYTYASDPQVDASAQVLAQSGGPPTLTINSDPFTNTTSNHKTQVEPGSFAFGNTIVSAEQSGRFFDGGASDISFSTSTDSGQTWSRGTLPATVNSVPAGPYARTSDVSVAYDRKHNVWMMSYLGIKTPNTADVAVSRSTDGGMTFGPPVIVHSAGTDLLDKNWTTCDNSQSSPFYGHCYTEFDDNAQLNLVQLSTSTDGGATWGSPRTTPDGACVIGGQPLVQPNGTLIMPISDCFESSVLSIRSTDGGETLTLPSFVGQEIFFSGQGNLRNGGLVSADIDQAGRVYVTWIDCRMQLRCTAGVDDLMLSTSDNGIDWSVPKRIPIAPIGGTTEVMLPGLGVDHTSAGDSAKIGLVYYFYPNQVIGNNFCTTSQCQLEVGFTSSRNSGKTWSPPQTLAGPMSLHWLPLTTQGFMVGDYFATSVVSRNNNGPSVAFPMFMVASPPSSGTTCSNETTGAPGQACNQPTFTQKNGITLGNSGGNAEIAAQTASEAAAGAPSASGLHLEIPDHGQGIPKRTVN